VQGADPQLDTAIAAYPRMAAYLQQTMEESSSLHASHEGLASLLASL
jgi:flagellar biosynthesis/type III secretory pathway ATPase